MGNDLFVMLDNSKYNDVVRGVQDRVEGLIAHRHDYPIWPRHSGSLDAFEQEYHGYVRSVYYINTIFMIQVLRKLRNIS